MLLPTWHWPSANFFGHAWHKNPHWNTRFSFHQHVGQRQGQWLSLLELPTMASLPLVFATFLTLQTVGLFILSFLPKQKLNSWPGNHGLSPFAPFAFHHYHACCHPSSPTPKHTPPLKFQSYHCLPFPNTVLPFTSTAHCHQLEPPSSFILNSASLV